MNMAWGDAHHLSGAVELALLAAVELRAEILEVDRPAVNALACFPIVRKYYAGSTARCGWSSVGR